LTTLGNKYHIVEQQFLQILLCYSVLFDNKGDVEQEPLDQKSS